MIGAPLAPFSNAKSPNLPSLGSTWRKNAPAIPFCPPASIESANFFESFTIACEPESFLIPTTTSGGLKLACVTQLTVAAVAVPPCAAPRTNSPYGIIKSACFFTFSSMMSRTPSSKKLCLPTSWRGSYTEAEIAPMALIKSKTPKIKGLHEVGRYAVGVQWVDGHDSIFPLENLRRGCLCDACKGSVSGEVPPASLRMRQLSRLGEAAVFIGWVDGHETIYTMPQLRSLCRCAYCVAEPERPITGG